MRGRFSVKIFAAVMMTGMVLPGLVAQDLEYVIQKGETLFSIAKNHGLILQEILDTNHLTSKSTIKVGQKILLPGKGTPESTVAVPSVTPAVATEKYTVQKGDTLYGIARLKGVDLKLLLKTNKLTEKSAIAVGQVVLVPVKPEAIAASPSPSPVAAAKPSPTPSPATVAAVAASPSPSASQSVDMAENTAQASEGTWLKTKPYANGANLSWPHPGERLQVEGKLPGLLIRASKGDPIKAVCSGKVVYSGPHSTLGHIVFIQNPGGFIYIYGGNDGSVLKTGDAVKSGDAIGQVGLTPGFPEPEVYFSTWKDGTYIDPATVPRD